MKTFTLAICQNQPGFDKQANIEAALAMIKQAAAGGAGLILLPEIFYHAYELKKIPGIAESNGETLGLLQQAARDAHVYLCTGSLAEKEGSLIYNRAYLLDPQGTVLLTFSKANLFDVEFPGLTVKESAVFTRGNAFPVVSTEFGNIGILICYDIRFPETGRALARQGVEIILVPAAFNHITGPAHWHITLRTRAVENQCYVAAASPALFSHSTYKAYGHSLVADPWGRVLAEAGTGAEIIYSELSADTLTDTRARLPLLKNIGL